MNFNPNPFEQAEAEVKNKSVGDQILHSKMLHSFRSAVSSKGSFGSKAAGALVGGGKLFLSLIPVPVVGAIAGAIVDKVESGVRDYVRDRKKADPTTSNAERVKIQIKELTVENLDRYRWKVAQAYEELNQGITAFNQSEGCDAIYSLALLIAQVDRRQARLKGELKKFQDALDAVNGWIASIDVNRQKVDDLKLKLAEDMKQAATARANMALADPGMVKMLQLAHKDCEKWCCVRAKVKYTPNDTYADYKEWAGKIARIVVDVSTPVIAVRQSDYTNDSNNSKFS